MRTRGCAEYHFILNFKYLMTSWRGRSVLYLPLIFPVHDIVSSTQSIGWHTYSLGRLVKLRHRYEGLWVVSVWNCYLSSSMLMISIPFAIALNHPNAIIITKISICGTIYGGRPSTTTILVLLPLLLAIIGKPETKLTETPLRRRQESFWLYRSID